MPGTSPQQVEMRDELVPGDVEAISQLVAETGYFSPEEIAIATELVADRLALGAKSDYRFVLAGTGGRLLGYTCYGRIPGTQSSFDLYWIVVAPSEQRRGLGSLLLAETEHRALAGGAMRIYVDTSGRAQYENTRAFYVRNGYCPEATLCDFYGPGDDKVIFSKLLC